MRPVSDRLLRTIRGSHKMVARARVCTTFQMGTDPDGTEIPIEAGDVELDATADVRSTIDLTTDGKGWVPKPGNLLTPYGNEVFAERAVEFGDGVREWVSLGYFRMYSVDQTGSNTDDPVQIIGRDRMSAIVDAKLETPRQFNPTHTLQQVFDSLVLEVLPGVDIVTDGFTNLSAVALGRTMIVEQDRYAALLDVVRAISRVMYFNHRGELFVGRPPDPAAPVFDVNAGRNGVLVSLRRSINRDGVFNAVVAIGEAADTEDPVWAVARDMAPTSPTFWEGTFGKVPRFYSSPLITTVGQAQTAAASLLQQSIGLPYSVDFSAVPNPALEPLDPVLVSTRQGSETHILDKITVPLTADQPLTASTRELTEINIEVEGV